MPPPADTKPRPTGFLPRRTVNNATSFPRFLARASWHYRSLTRVVDNTRRIRPRDILLVACQRNELARLPRFFDYYRALGVGQFLLVDNGSDDGSAEWLASQPDCSLWHTTASYRDANFGMHWCNALLGRYGSGHWCITVDPDEFLVYPRMETRSLRALCGHLEDEGRRSFQTLTLDAYSDRPLAATAYRSGDDPFAVCPFFDRDGYSQKPGWGRATFIQGGPRLRSFYADHPGEAPALNKTPLIKWRWYYHYRSSMHDGRPVHLNDAQWRGERPVTGCLFHFKFMSSLSAKAAEEMGRKQHYADSAEYSRYASAGNVTLFRDGLSVRYTGPEQLVELGLMSQGDWF